jgi:3-hydroxybenzoate 6-monooxygenase
VSASLPYLVVGGGIGGLAAAIALARQGVAVRVLEQASTFREVGAGIQLGPNVFHALKRIGLREAVLADAWVPGALEMRDALDGHLITRMPLNDAGFQSRFPEPYAVTHRADLHETLLQACRREPLISLENGRTVAGVEEGDEGVRARLETGEAAEGQALVAADGLWSKVRETIVGDGPPRVSGHIAYRAVLRRDEVPEDLWRPDVVLWAGPRTHLVHYPLRRGELYNLVVVFHSDRYVEGWNAEGAIEELALHFHGQRPEVTRLLDKIEAWRMWVLCDREPVRRWSRGRIALLGDAAHPMLQYLAQGACMAIEDAVTLGEAVARTPNDPARAFETYTDARYLRTARVQLMARVYGEAYHARGPVAELRDQMLAGRGPAQAYDGIAWLYDGQPALA